MAEPYVSLSRADQTEVLEIASQRTGRPAHLLEKDVWVVWTLGVLFESSLAQDLTFKGGTSLSKAYQIIDRFSEDIDLTCDIRKLIGDLTVDQAHLPTSRSQASKWTKAVRERLPIWIETQVQPLLTKALAQAGMQATLEVGGAERDKLLLHYPANKQGTGYVKPTVTLEFGGRATGEPHQAMPVVCDMAGQVAGVDFPVASPVVMSVARTFWEKATAAHVYCAQGRLRGERYARHWHDLIAIHRSQHFEAVMRARDVALNVAAHKSFFFSEKDAAGEVIDYMTAVTGGLNIVPQGRSREALEADYSKMLEDEVLLASGLPFDTLMRACDDLTTHLNRSVR